MKKLLLLLLLYPLMAMAEFYPGTLTFTDGSTKSGFIEIPGTAEKNKVAFRTSQKGKTEKFKIDLVKSFTVTNDEKAEITYFALKLADPKTFKRNEFKISKDKSWVRIAVMGKINIVSAYFYSPAVAGAIASTASSGYNYYFWKPENDYCSYFHSDVSHGITINVGLFNALKKGVEMNFGKECPQLAELLKKDDIKQNGLAIIVRLYEENCGASK